MTHSLLTLFAPPDDYVGDFGMFCGFTASRDAVDRIARTFSGDGSRPHLAAFIHPTAQAVTDVPGVAWMHFTKSPFKLLHAKVALLGFYKRGAPYLVRLAVSTGNWTSSPLGTSIDMFWADDLVVGASDPQLESDVLAARDLFKWLLEHTDNGLLDHEFDGAKPSARLFAALDALPRNDMSPRVFDTRMRTAFDQVVERCAGDQPFNRLVLGSGYFEGGEDAGTGVIEGLRKSLVEKGILSSSPVLDLVLNPDNCQGLHAQAEDLARQKWHFRRPGSPFDGHETAKLHAKFLFLGENDGAGAVGSSRLYIGSANFSKHGFRSKVRGGNLEAGIVLEPDPELSWRANAPNGILKLLPVNLKDVVELSALKPGDDYEAPPKPPAPPPVTYLEWSAGQLCMPGGRAKETEETIRVEGPTGKPLSLPVKWGAPPAFVTLLPDGWKVPVFANGALVVRPRGDRTVEDVLAEFAHFPLPPSADEIDREEDGTAEGTPAMPDAEAPEAERTYPIRRMMRLIVGLTKAQKAVDPYDWGRWCREIGEALIGLAKTERETIDLFKSARANPLSALLDVEFLPDGVDGKKLETAIERASEFWELAGAESLWEVTRG